MGTSRSLRCGKSLACSMLLASHGANTDPFTAGVDDEGYQGLLGWMCVVLIVWHRWRRSRPITSGQQGLNRAVAAFHAPPAPVRNSVVVRHALLVLTVSKRHALSQHNATPSEQRRLSGAHSAWSERGQCAVLTAASSFVRMH